MSHNSIKELQCVICAGPMMGRQYHNIDTGKGICTPCVPARQRQIGASGMEASYGLAGFHYKIAAERTTPLVFTAFCQEASGTGTIWIDEIGPFTHALTTEKLRTAAREKCAREWGYYEDEEETTPRITDIHCLGLAEGSIKITHWEDIPE